MARLSGPLLDRIDIHIDVPPLSFEEISANDPSGPASSDVRGIVQETRDRQRARYKDTTTCNAHVESKKLREVCRMNDGASKLLEIALEQLGLSARAYDKVLRVARTIADLDHAETITDAHVAEAVQYRSLDRAAN
jgi:magnesium chelatase family protein